MTNFIIITQYILVSVYQDANKIPPVILFDNNNTKKIYKLIFIKY